MELDRFHLIKTQESEKKKIRGRGNIYQEVWDGIFPSTDVFIAPK